MGTLDELAPPQNGVGCEGKTAAGQNEILPTSIRADTTRSSLSTVEDRRCKDKVSGALDQVRSSPPAQREHRPARDGLPVDLRSRTSSFPLGRLHPAAAAAAGPEPPPQARAPAHNQPVLRPKDQQGEGVAEACSGFQPVSSAGHGVHETEPATAPWPSP